MGEMMAVELKNVCAAYGRGALADEQKHILKDISLRVPEGSSVCILGCNGCGKTTLLRAMTGMLPYRGEIRICGKALSELDRRNIAENIAVMTQLSEVYFSYTVYETVLLGRYVRLKGIFGRIGKQDREIALSCMERTGIADLRDRQIGELSGGQLQRVFLARTLAQEAPILLLDEPMNHLDIKVMAQLADYLEEWRRQPGHTLIGVFHDVAMAARISDQLLLMKEGRILGMGNTEEMLAGERLRETYDFDILEFLRGMRI